MGFDGFARGAERFFHQLAVEMSRDWYAANKADYEALWLQPMQALLDAVRAEIAPSYRAVGLAAPKVFRIHRDVRFARDKTPYKTHIAGAIPVRHGKRPTQQPAALYVSFGLDEETLAGIWIFAPESLVRWRKKLLDPRAGREVERLVAAITARKWRLISAESLARPPRGFAADHPRLALARMKGLCVDFGAMPRGLIHKPALVGWLAERSKAVAPLVTWLARNVA